MARAFDGLSLDRKRRIDVVCREFEESRYDETPPELSSFVGRVPDEDRNEALRELLAIEFELRLAETNEIPVAEFLAQFPDDTELIDGVFHEVNESLEERQRLGHASLPLLGDYQLLRELGRGGMGIVYEAQQLSLNRSVAIKLLPPHMLSDKQRRLRFEREAIAAGKLHHTNIVPVFGVGECNGQVFYVMQFIDGQSVA